MPHTTTPFHKCLQYAFTTVHSDNHFHVLTFLEMSLMYYESSQPGDGTKWYKVVHSLIPQVHVQGPKLSIVTFKKNSNFPN
jgi:hypothetical protein